jgi:hypothetical protein
MRFIFCDVTPCGLLKKSLAYSSTLKMEAICFSETSVDIQLTIQSCIPEDITLHNHRYQILRSYMTIIVEIL